MRYSVGGIVNSGLADGQMNGDFTGGRGIRSFASDWPHMLDMGSVPIYRGSALNQAFEFSRMSLLATNPSAVADPFSGNTPPESAMYSVVALPH